MRIVMLGAPGSGKGTQAQRIQKDHGLPQESDLVIAVTSGILVPMWAILLWRGTPERDAQPFTAAA